MKDRQAQAALPEAFWHVRPIALFNLWAQHIQAIDLLAEEALDAAAFFLLRKTYIAEGGADLPGSPLIFS